MTSTKDTLTNVPACLGKPRHMLFILPYLQQFKLHCLGHSVINRRSKVGQHRAVDNRSHNPDYHVYYPATSDQYWMQYQNTMQTAITATAVSPV